MTSHPNSPLCSIVIRAFNEEQHIGKLLSGIMQQTVENHEIVLVDSGSTDATVAIASRFPVRVLSIEPQQFTFGRALNIGCAEARGEHLVFASAHVYPVYPNWLERLLAPFQDPQVALVYGKQRGEAGSRFSEKQVFEKLYSDRSVPQQTSPICNNANAAVRRSLWAERHYDEHLPGLEDVDWANWALRQGRYLAYAAEAEVVHVHDETPRQVYNRYRREAIGLRSIRPDQRVGLWATLKLLLSNLWSDLWEAARERRLPRVLWEIIWFRTMQFWGTYRGFAYAGPVTDELIRAFYYPRSVERAGEKSVRKAESVAVGAVPVEQVELMGEGAATPAQVEPIDYSAVPRVGER